MVFYFWRHKIQVMQKLLLFVDRISTWVGQAFSFLIVGLTLHISWEVFSRYALDNPRAWAESHLCSYWVCRATRT